MHLQCAGGPTNEDRQETLGGGNIFLSVPCIHEIVCLDEVLMWDVLAASFRRDQSQMTMR